jgi:phosphoglycerol transferase MdoB-like AlkP superfamily enzyme
MKSRPLHPLLALLCNIALLYVLYFACRVVYIFEFWDILSSNWNQIDTWQLLWGGFRFDTAAICYTNIPYMLMVLIPLSPRLRDSRGWRVATRLLYVVINTLALWTNLFDTVYSRYTGRRTTSSFLSEFADEGNLSNIFFTELLNHWYLVFIGIVFLVALVVFHRTPNPEYTRRHRLQGTLCTLVVFFLAVTGIRGGLSYHRPLSLADANGYVNQAKEANMVLNTPFTLIRTIGKTTFTDPQYFTQDELDNIYSPLHNEGMNAPANSQFSILNSQLKKNVVILILESFGEEYWGFYHNGKGYTPFLDSLATQSLTFTHSYANGRKSIDALPSILSSIPMFVEPFILTRYSNNEVSSIASCLRHMGYRTTFFHGADNASMGFRSYALATGFQDYYGMDEYCLDNRFGGHDDFDGYWAIWDEEFMQYFALMLDTLPRPFMATLFTATSHHPFNIPTRYQDTFRGGNLPVYLTIEYTDYALRQFFRTASQMPWYDNTLFVITADHTNVGEQEEYKTDLGLFRVPILFFDPSGQLPRGISQAVAQQTDIMPTVLGILGYPQPYLAYGIDLLATPPQQTWAVSYTNGIYQYVVGDTLLHFDGQKVIGLYNLATDPLLKHNLLTSNNTLPDCRHLQALIQSYMQRMINNQLVITSNTRTN